MPTYDVTVVTTYRIEGVHSIPDAMSKAQQLVSQNDQLSAQKRIIESEHVGVTKL